MTGGAGDDLFVWLDGHQGSPDSPATDTITDFGNGKDTLDISDLLQQGGNGIDEYLSVSEEEGKTVINISSKGNGESGIDQKIVLDNVDFDQDVASKIVDALKNGGTLSSDDLN